MSSIRKYWNNIVTVDAETNNRKAMVRGFLKLWKEDWDQLFYKVLMMENFAL